MTGVDDAEGFGAPDFGEGLGQAQQAVAVGSNVEGLACAQAEVGLVELAIEVGVGGGFVQGGEAVAVGVVGVAGLRPCTVKLGEAVAVVVACGPAQGGLVALCDGDGDGVTAHHGGEGAVGPQALADAGDALRTQN